MITGAAHFAYKYETGQQVSAVLLLQFNVGSQLHTRGNVSTLLQWEEWQIGGSTILVQTSFSSVLQPCFEYLMIQ